MRKLLPILGVVSILAFSSSALADIPPKGGGGKSCAMSTRAAEGGAAGLMLAVGAAFLVGARRRSR